MSDSQHGLRHRWTRGEIVFFLGVGVVCLAVLIVIGKMSTPGVEEWDTPLSFQFLLPIAAMGAFLGGFLFPGHSWRLGLAPWWMQHMYMLWRHGPGNIWPIAIVFWALALLPFVALARLGASISVYVKRKVSVSEKLVSSNPRLKTDVENARLSGSLIRHGLAASCLGASDVE